MDAKELKQKLVDLNYELRTAFEREMRRCFMEVFGPTPTIDEYYLNNDIHNFFMSAAYRYFDTVLTILDFAKQYYESKDTPKSAANCELWLRRDEFDHNLLLVEESASEGYRVLGNLPLPALEALLGGDISGWLPPGCRCKATLTVNVGGQYW